ncbi:MMPL family transporter [Clostridium boliviensis]|uniref:MMPL family transporter n=1 Tax=Clostridium boliviensis TaxID=318465 RepID=A0ABU4GSC8_9CLOT|nr:MMPL family transporter [Clostridium boliviensis]MDW2800537.1 MMPL family transporter [Clostridium boliviensis]
MNKSRSIFDKLVHFIVFKGKIIESIFFAATVICAACFPFVKVNYDLSKYLPQFAQTKQALDVMEDEFGYPGMARIMVQDVSLQEAERIRTQISDLEGVDVVVGPDLATDVYMGASFANEGLTDLASVDVFSMKDYYREGNALMDVIFEKGDDNPLTRTDIEKIYTIVGKDRGCFAGSAVSSKEREESITHEITIAIGMALVIIWLILTLTTTSWVEPFLFILIMIIAIILNMGSNLMFGTISFFTFSTAAILQLAVSMDYSIFLLHTFTAIKNTGVEINKAMEMAVKESCSSILASGATTIVGFIVIAFMRFTIGKDVGFVLTKGIICSLATVLLLMPTLILHFNNKIEKTAHKPFIPSFDRFSRLMNRIRKPVFVIAALLAIPCYFGQSMNAFYYGDDAIGAGPGTRVYEDTRKINEVFGKSNMVIGIVPNGSVVTERQLTDALEDLDFVNYAISMSGTIPRGIPESFLPDKVTKQLRSSRYARFLISMNTVQESQYAFDCSQKLEGVIRQYYPGDAYVIGMTPTTIDIRDILTDDYNKVSLLSLAGVALVVLITFQAVLVPILVIIPIEVAIYLNMTLPYVMGDSLVYIGYIIVSCLQLGATIDYSILMTNNYLGFRKTMNNTDSAMAAISKSTLSILTSGGILTVVGYLLFFTSSIQAISQVGRLVGRGAILSMVLVLSLLPALLSLFDRQIQKQQERAARRKERRFLKYMKVRGKLKGGDGNE